MNRKLLLLLALLLFSYGLSSCSSDDNNPSKGEQTDTPELFTKRYNPDQSFYSKILDKKSNIPYYCLKSIYRKVRVNME